MTDDLVKSSEIRLSAELSHLAEQCRERPMTFGEIMGILQGRAFLLLLVLMVLPFTAPISIPGMSTPFGLSVMVISAFLGFGLTPWLPAWLRRRVVPAGLFSRILLLSGKVLGFLERRSRPRWLCLLRDPWPVRAHFVLASLAGAVLLLPLPIPLTNTFPAWVVLLVVVGLLERDGLAVALAYATALVGALYFFLLSELATHFAERFIKWCRDLL